MTDILKDKVPTRIKVEIWLDIDLDLYLEAVESGTEPMKVLYRAVKGITLKSKPIIADYDRLEITAIKYEGD